MRARGFTLVELLVVVAIGTLLVSAAVPSLASLIASTRAANAADAMVMALERARSEAIRTGGVVSVCRTLDPGAPEDAIACSNAAGGEYAAGDWSSGWVIFEKRGARSAGSFEGGSDRVLQRQQPVGAGRFRPVIAGNLRGAAVAYDRFGTAASGAGTFSVDYRDPASPSLTPAARCVVVAAVTGRVSVRRPVAGACA